MRSIKFFSRLLISTALLLTPINNLKVTEKNPPPKITKIASLTPLDFEIMKGLSSWYGTIEEYNVIGSFIEGHNILKDIDKSIVEERDSLVKMVREYAFRNNKLNHYRYINEVYPKFVELNKRIDEKKSRRNIYDILEKGQNSLFVVGNYGYPLKEFQRKTLEKYSLYINFLESLTKKYSKESYYNVASTTILNCSDLLSIINELNKGIGLNKEIILSLISSESLGYKYLTGRSGDINMFQIYPRMINSLYSRLKKSKLEEDNLYKKIFSIDNIALEEFKDSILEDPVSNVVLGMYLMKELNKESYNESHFVLLYHLGALRFSLLPSELRGKIINGKINSSYDIREDKNNKAANYLYHYFKKKEHFLDIKNSFSVYNSTLNEDSPG